MKLQNLSNITLQKQEMASVKGGCNRAVCITTRQQAMLDNAIKLTSKDPIKTNTTMLNIYNKGICIHW